MKRIVLVTVATLFFATAGIAQSQTEAKNFFLNAELSGLKASFTPAPFSLGVNAGGGYFLIDNLALRAQAGVGFTAGQDGGDSNINVNFGVGGRYYLHGFFLDALFQGANIGRNEHGEKQLEVGIQGALGYAIFLNDHVAFEPALTLGKFFIEGSDFNVGLNAAFSIYF
ncbi:MAG: hypothetical protein LBB31_01580 [Prevotellaceae bacterium]|jgi:hypothetical protein|nr:hypothetical protein [Prevotellaceae bacterium]